MEEKITNLTSQIFGRFEKMFNEIVETCDSPIEKLLFVLIINRITERRDFENKFEIDTSYYDPIPELSEKDELYFKLCKKRFTYSHKDGVYPFKFRYSSIKIAQNISTNAIGTDGLGSYDSHKTGYGYRTIYIEPQYVFISDDLESRYFIDIAIISKIKYDKIKEGVIEAKIALECDGHEFHSDATQIKNDNIRMRRLMADGWKVLRYNGREIYSFDEHNFDEILNEIIGIIMPD